MAKLNIKLKIEIIIALLVIICALLGFAVSEKVETYVFEEDAIFYINGVDYDVEAGDKAKVDDKENIVTIIRSDETELTSKGLPIYIKDKQAILLINDMVYFKPNGNYLDGFKLTYFTRLENLDNSGAINLSWETKQDLEKSGFLFDGNDKYVVLDDVYLELNDRTIELGPLSYIVVSRGNFVEYFDVNTKIYDFINTENNVIIRDKDGKYKIIADLDFAEVGEKTYMFQSNVSNYSNYFGKGGNE